MTPTLVTLVVPSKGLHQTLAIDHAERLLRMPDNGGWVLPADSQFEYAPATGLRKRVQTQKPAASHAKKQKD